MLKILVFIVNLLSFSYCTEYVINDTPGLGLQFDGIGAISGGGVSVYDSI